MNDAHRTSHEARVAKPDRRIFDEALILGNAQSNQALHIGENYELDYLGARDAGWHALWLNRGDESTGADDFLQ